MERIKCKGHEQKIQDNENRNEMKRKKKIIRKDTEKYKMKRR